MDFVIMDHVYVLKVFMAHIVNINNVLIIVVKMEFVIMKPDNVIALEGILVQIVLYKNNL